MTRKIPKCKKEPQQHKTPKAKLQDVEFAEGRPLAWRFSSSDKNGAWAWNKLTDLSEHKEVIEKLHEFEGYNIRSLTNTGSHPIPLCDLCENARKRLAEIQQDDNDELFSLRINGKKRLFCIQAGNIMKILWWDPNHTVCPSKKKNT